MDLIKKIASSIYFWIGLVITILLAVIGHENSKNKLLELDLDQANLNGKQKVLEEDKKHLESDITSEKEYQKQLLEKKQKEENSSLSPSEIEDFYKKH